MKPGITPQKSQTLTLVSALTFLRFLRVLAPDYLKAVASVALLMGLNQLAAL